MLHYWPSFSGRWWYGYGIGHWALSSDRRINGGYKSESIDARVREIIINELGVEPEKVTDDASFVEDLGADSLDTVELVMAFEEEFGLDIPDEDAEKMRTVGDAVGYLNKQSDN